MLKKVIIIRHGDYDSGSGRINSSGIKQMHKLATIIKGHISEEQNVIFLSSSAPRAEDSAAEISELIGLSFESCPELWSDNRHHEDNDRVVQLLKENVTKKDATMAILLTHLEYGQRLPGYITRDAGHENTFRSGLEKGQMLVMDIENNTWEKYPK